MNNVSKFKELQGVLGEMCVTGQKVGADAEIYGSFAHSEELFAFIVEMLKGEPQCPVIVDYNLPWREMIARCRLDHVNEGVNEEDFPRSEAKGRQEVCVHLVQLNAPIRNTVLKQIDERGFRPAVTPEFLAVGAQYSEMQKWYTIIAPRDRRDALALKTTNMASHGVELHRVLYKFGIWRGWKSPTIRFAVVPK